MDKLEKYMEEERKRRGYVDSFLSAMKRRLNLQMIGGFIRDGGTQISVINDCFQQRETKAFSKLQQLLSEKYGEREADEILDCVNDYSDVILEIYFSLWMKAGAIPQCKLTDNLETDL